MGLRVGSGGHWRAGGASCESFWQEREKLVAPGHSWGQGPDAGGGGVRNRGGTQAAAPFFRGVGGSPQEKGWFSGPASHPSARPGGPGHLGPFSCLGGSRRSSPLPHSLARGSAAGSGETRRGAGRVLSAEPGAGGAWRGARRGLLPPPWGRGRTPGSLPVFISLWFPSPFPSAQGQRPRTPGSSSPSLFPPRPDAWVPFPTLVSPQPRVPSPRRCQGLQVARVTQSRNSLGGGGVPAPPAAHPPPGFRRQLGGGGRERFQDPPPKPGALPLPVLVPPPRLPPRTPGSPVSGTAGT